MSVLSSGFLLVLTAFAYLIASVFYGAGTVRADGEQRRVLLIAGFGAAIVGVLLHTAAIGVRCIETRQTPFVTGYETLSAVGWAIVLTFLLIQVFGNRERTAALGALGMPLAFLSVFTSSVIRSVSPAISVPNRLLDGNLVSLHVLAIIFAFGLLALAVGCALIYLMEDAMLKRKAVAQLLFWRLPPLNAIDNLAFTLVSLAFPLLTVGILAGMVRAAALRLPASNWTLEPHTLASIVTWAIYGFYIWVHAGMRWRGRRSNSLLLAGLAAALITYFIPSSLHQFG